MMDAFSFDLANFIVTIAALGTGILIGVVTIKLAQSNNKKQDEAIKQAKEAAAAERQLQLASSAPQLLFDWKSNYRRLRITVSDASEAERQLHGVLQIKVAGGGQLDALTISAVFGFDHAAVQRPYRRSFHGKQLNIAHANALTTSSPISIPIFELLRNNGFDLRMLFSDPDSFQQLTGSVPCVAVEQGGRWFPEPTASRSAPHWNPHNFRICAIFGRIVISYTFRGLEYLTVLKYTVGTAWPLVDEVGVAFADHFDKLMYTSVASGNQQDVVPIHQATDNHEEDVPQTVGDTNFLTIRATKANGDGFYWTLAVRVVPQAADATQ